MTVLTTDSFRLSVDQALSLASGQAGRRQIRSLAGRDNWLRCGSFGAFIWGEYGTSNHGPIQVLCDTASLTVSCTCRSRQRPCNHGPALYLRWLDHPQRFTHDRRPPWLSGTDPAIQPAPSAPDLQSDQWPTVMRGLTEFELWLHDLMRAGLAGLPEQPKGAWRGVSDRLADAHLNELARTINALASLPGTTPDWPETLLVELGRMHLLIQAFKQWDGLPAAQQGDLRLAAGWLDDALAATGDVIHDRWHVIADEQTKDGLLSRRRTWLWAERSNRVAEVSRRSTLPQGVPTPPREALLPTSVGIDGALRFYPATTPISGVLAETRRFFQPGQRPAGYATIETAFAAYNSTLTQNPWCTEFPMLIAAAHAQRADGRWRLVDSAGAMLPIADEFTRGWHLRALSLDAATAIFGLWNGTAFRPVSLWADQRWLRLELLRGVA